MSKYDVPGSDIDEDYHPSRETKAKFLEDDLLRKNGYEIAARPEGKEAVWAKGGVRFRHSEALLRIGGQCSQWS